VTPTEAAVLAGVRVHRGLFVYREIKWRDLPAHPDAVVTAAVCFRSTRRGGLRRDTAGPATVLNATLAVPGGNVVFSCSRRCCSSSCVVREGLPAVVILLPTFMPVVTRLGIDLVHYSTVVVAATGIGLFLPPIGVGFFIACGIAKVPVDRASGAMLPYVWMMCIGLLVVILFPWFTLVVPRLLKLV
jgi:TRAP-type C4-dicarboxylate transport system permease large subunit